MTEDAQWIRLEIMDINDSDDAPMLDHYEVPAHLPLPERGDHIMFNIATMGEIIRREFSHDGVHLNVCLYVEVE